MTKLTATLALLYFTVSRLLVSEIVDGGSADLINKAHRRTDGLLAAYRSILPLHPTVLLCSSGRSNRSHCALVGSYIEAPARHDRFKRSREALVEVQPIASPLIFAQQLGSWTALFCWRMGSPVPSGAFAFYPIDT